MHPYHRILQTLGLVLLAATLLACGAGGVVATHTTPRWACPSPLPLPFGATGPVKDYLLHTRPISEGGDWREPIYFAEWEREYGQGGSLLGAAPAFDGPPFPSPTPYGISGTSYVFGQRVEVAPLHLQVQARAAALVGAQQLYLIDLRWHNPTGAPQLIDYRRQVLLRSIIGPTGALHTGDGWSTSYAAQQAGGTGALPPDIPAGESHVTLALLAPPGRPKTVEVRFDTWLAAATPTIGTTLPSDTRRQIVVQWSDTQLAIGPPCNDPGALTAWDGAGWGQAAPVLLAPPAGTDRLVQLALGQVGKRYVWGSTGPDSFDCSGLVVWAYNRIGIGGLPRTTGGQFPAFVPLAPGQAAPGDLAYFDIERRGFVDHVGLLVGDIDGDGRMDMVHAASPKLGVRVVSDLFGSAYYTPRLLGLRTLRGWQGGR